MGRIKNYLKILKSLLQFLKSSETKISKKILVVILSLFSVLYLLLPVDLIPDLIPVLGFMEDITVILSMFTVIGKIIEKEHPLSPKDDFREGTQKAPVIDVEVIDDETSS